MFYCINLRSVHNEPLIVHLFVPLYDNEHQGIIPTSKSLGDGLNLKTHLYWPTSAGTKAYFKKNAKWKFLFQAFDIDANVLGRLVFKQVFITAKVYLIADAYRGNRMEETVNGVAEDQLCLNAGKIYCLKHNCGAGAMVYKSEW